MPDGIVTTGYPAVQDKCRDLGIEHDDWQQGLGRLVLGKRADGKYAATVGGIVLSIGRQIGKTFFVGSVIIALCLLFPGMTVLWTAHHTRTSDETFAKLQGLVKRPKVRPYLLTVRRANGQQSIEFRNGSRILFGARETGFGRGFSEIDVEVFDEAQILTERGLEDMVAATNQAKHPGGALLFYMGTPPRPIDPGEAFTNKRRKALSGKSKDMVFVEMSADHGCDPDDQVQWAKANPSFPARTPVESMQRLRENVGSVESFVREGLGVWDVEDSDTVIPYGVWQSLADDTARPPKPVGKVAFSVDTTPDRRMTSISVAGVRPDGVPQVQVVENRVGVKWAVKVLAELANRNDSYGVVIDSQSAAASIVDDLEAEGVEIIPMNTPDAKQAFGQFYDRCVESGDIRHLNQPGLNAALKGALDRAVGDARLWDRKKPTVDITPLVSATNALWGWTTRHGTGELQIF